MVLRTRRRFLQLTSDSRRSRPNNRLNEAPASHSIPIKVLDLVDRVGAISSARAGPYGRIGPLAAHSNTFGRGSTVVFHFNNSGDDAVRIVRLNANMLPTSNHRASGTPRARGRARRS
jgi:hypothetical protein